MWVGIPQLFIIPFIPKLMRFIDVRLIIGVGLVLFGISCLMDAFMDLNFAMDQFRVSNIVRALGQPLVIIPLLSVATAGLPKEETGSASAIFNMMRNLGGSVGIALLSTLVTRREQFHSVRIGETVTLLTPQVIARISSLDSMLRGKGLDPTTAHDTALTILNGRSANPVFHHGLQRIIFGRRPDYVRQFRRANLSSQACKGSECTFSPLEFSIAVSRHRAAVD